MYSNSKQILHLLSLMKSFKIKKVVISPGSRHYPITHSLENDSYFELYSVVDERSAAFFALGLIQETNEPSAIICSSGTASVNYSSAVCEAFYQRLPLLVLTTDRIPEFLGQMEDQMIKQDDVFQGFIKYQGQLPSIISETDEWYCNRIINEALISLDHHGKGPVHLNIPVLSHHTDTFQTAELPVVRKITCNNIDLENSEWTKFSEKLKNEKVMIIWGQSVTMSKKLSDALDNFTNTFNTVIITDKISNCHHTHSIENTFAVLSTLTETEKKDLSPKIVITIGGNYVFNNEIKQYLNQFSNQFENWLVGKEDTICDPFRRLTDIFEMSEETFLNSISQTSTAKTSSTSYFDKWNEISEMIEEPNVGYSQLYAIGELIKSLPKDVVLHLANSATIRMGQLFNIDKSIRCHCNRGVNGIDGCMSTTVGFASSSDKQVFLIIGDLAFFYDMNAVWNRHLSQNLRILLINNEGGAVMHMPFNAEVGKTLSKYTSAGHQTSAKGWVESTGFKYMSATNQEEVDKGISELTDISVKGPIILEVFTNKEEDVLILKNYFSSLKRFTFSERAQRKAEFLMSKFLRINK